MRRSYLVFASIFGMAIFGRALKCQNPTDKSNSAIRPRSDTQLNVKATGEPQWLVLYSVGSSKDNKSQWATVKFTAAADGASKEGQVLVDATSITQVIYSSRKEGVSERIQGPRNGCAYAKQWMPSSLGGKPAEILISASAPGVVHRFASDLLQKDVVQVSWKCGALERTVSIELNACEYRSFLAHLRSMLGARWSQLSTDSSAAH